MHSSPKGFWQNFFGGYVPHIVVSSVGGIASSLVPDKHLQVLGYVATLVAVFLISVASSLFRQSASHNLLLLLRTSDLWLKIHDVVHGARDSVLRRLPPVPDLSAPLPLTPEDRAEIEREMVRIKEVFSKVVSRKTKLMVTARELRRGGKYHTFVRVGEFNPNRSQTTKPLGADDATIRTLSEKLRNHLACVILTGSGEGEGRWTPQFNDRFESDIRVLMGAALVKNPTGDEFTPGEIKWIISVCANREDAFSEEHIPLMQTCLDNLSLYANVLARKSALSGEIITRTPSDIIRIAPEDLKAQKGVNSRA